MSLRLVRSEAAPSSFPRAPRQERTSGRAGAGLVLVWDRDDVAANPQPPARPIGIVERLVRWEEAARRAGRTERADELFLLAWAAYDRSVRSA